MPSSAGYRQVTKNCVVCGKLLVLNNERDITRKKTCSNECRGFLSAVERKATLCSCVECGVEFESQVRAKRCKSCRNNMNLQISRSYAMLHNNPEKYFKHALYKKGREGLTVQFMLDLLEKQDGKCAITKQQLTFIKIQGNGRVNTNASIDQIKPAAGYTEDNVQIVCDIVNRMKIDMDMEELMFWCQSILTHSED